MKKLIIIVIVLVASSFTAGKDYEDGFKDGHCDGWKDEKGNRLLICPLAPLAPLPNIGEDDYKGGYRKGFKRGVEDAKK